MKRWIIEPQIRGELTCASMELLLTEIQRLQIPLTDIRITDPLSIEFTVPSGQWKPLKTLTRKRGGELKKIREYGFLQTLSGLLRRPILVTGIVLLVCLSFWVPGKIFFIQVEGNQAIPTRLILERAQQCGIFFGSTRKDVRSEQMKNSLLEAIPELQWAGINTYGCTAIISVMERTPTHEKSLDSITGNIIASADAIIQQMVVTEGTPLCKTGDAVKKGQVLVSGYTDCGIFVRAGQAKAEIYGRTVRHLTAVSPSFYQHRTCSEDTSVQFYLIIGKKRINFSNNSGISSATCAKIYEQKYISLPGGFILPFYLEKEIVRPCAYQKEVANDQQLLSEFTSNYLSETLKAGCILDTKESLTETNGFLCLHGKYTCIEMIGLFRPEEYIVNYEQNH